MTMGTIDLQYNGEVSNLDDGSGQTQKVWGTGGKLSVGLYDEYKTGLGVALEGSIGSHVGAQDFFEHADFSRTYGSAGVKAGFLVTAALMQATVRSGYRWEGGLYNDHPYVGLEVGFVPIVGLVTGVEVNPQRLWSEEAYDQGLTLYGGIQLSL